VLLETARRDNQWIQTYTGRRFWPLDPRAEEVEIEDIVHALAMKCRFTGHVREFYSVAQHSLLVADMCPLEDRRWALLHDAAEAYLPDVARPIKRQLSGFRAIEEKVLRCVARRFDLPWPMPQSVEIADVRALATERRDLMVDGDFPWTSIAGVMPLETRVWAMDPETAKREFEKAIRDTFTRG
jgi:hypothetical protein